ncbi:YceI family protein [Pedobacter sp. Hv1]|uniref:YceI family protein n=1 Tax=Pedobacter sp. Hv1 TaxID=1740090 RepID=UPI000A916683|nr:YceI family protein [Pedobacter sp. Hv1]
MKNFKNFVFQKTGLFSIVLLLIVVICISFVRTKEEEIYYKSYDRSKIAVEGSSTIGNWSVTALNFACNGYFSLEKDELQELSQLSFVLPVNELKGENPLMNEAMDELFRYNGVTQISFKQSNAMVLSVMKMTNVIGELQIGGKSNRVALQLHHVVNKDQSLTFRGTHYIKLSDYQFKMPETILGAIKNNDEIKIDLEITLSNEQIAVVKSQDLSR